MKMLIQVGNLGHSLLDHTISPIARANNVEKLFVVSRKPGPADYKVNYYCPPRALARIPFVAIIYELLTLLYLSLKQKPDVVAGFLLFPHGLLAFLVAKVTNRPLIVSLIAGPVELYAPGSPKSINYNKPLPFYGKVMLKVLKRAEGTVVKGAYSKKILVSHGVSAEKIFKITNVPNKTRFYRREVEKENDVIFVGRLARVKHVEVVLYTLKQVKEQFSKIKAIIVGDGPYRQELEGLSKKLGLENNVSFLGHQKDIPTLLNKSKIFILTSEREGFPNVYLEAILCGIPAVVSDCGDITDIAINQYNSLIIKDYRDYKSYASAIVGLLANPVKYKKLKNGVLQTADKLIKIDNGKTWEKVINLVTNGK